MKIDPKLKGGLAWAGLVVILAVPGADILFGKDNATKTTITSDTATVTPALKVPVVKPVVGTDPIETASVSGDPVDTFVSKGKKLPSYISDGDEVAVQKPAAVKPLKPVEVASVSPVEETPPVPLPRDARPKNTVIASVPAGEQPLILDENKVKQQDAAIDPFPLSDGGANDEVVTGDQLEEWDSGSLADYLANKGLLSDASDQQQPQASDDYDPDGFFLDEGPNRPKRQWRDDFVLF